MSVKATRSCSTPLTATPCSSTEARAATSCGPSSQRIGVSRIAAAIVTHDQADHVGGIEELLGALPIHRLIYAEPSRDFLGPARAAAVRARSIAAGASIDSGSLRLQVLWPPRSLLDGPAPDDPNREAVVLVARWHRFSILLAADAEAEAVPIDPGPVDVLKVAHHGSDDAGLGPLLDRISPRLAVISVGDDNPYGHPTPETHLHPRLAPGAHASHRF